MQILKLEDIQGRCGRSGPLPNGLPSSPGIQSSLSMAFTNGEHLQTLGQKCTFLTSGPRLKLPSPYTLLGDLKEVY